jgi:hypothetical protein
MLNIVGVIIIVIVLITFSKDILQGFKNNEDFMTGHSENGVLTTISLCMAFLMLSRNLRWALLFIYSTYFSLVFLTVWILLHIRKKSNFNRKKILTALVVHLLFMFISLIFLLFLV